MPAIVRTVEDETPEPATVGDMKLQCRVDHDLDDIILSACVRAARQAIEEEYSTALVPTTCTLRLDRFPFDCGYGEIQLRMGHVSAIESIQYVDTNGVTQTLAGSAYSLDSANIPARVRPAFGTSWPSTRDVMNAVTVTFTAGYATPDAVPQNTKAALLLIASELYDKREPTVTGLSIAEVPTFRGLLVRENWGAYLGAA